MHDDIDAAAADWLAPLTSAIMISSNTIFPHKAADPLPRHRIHRTPLGGVSTRNKFNPSLPSLSFRQVMGLAADCRARPYQNL